MNWRNLNLDTKEYTDTKKLERLKWFNECRFGMFIHWGLYSVMGKGEWAFFKESLPFSEYRKLADRFHPKFCDFNEMAQIAKDAGMRYMVLTAKHHDGFCLFDSRYTDFTSTKTAAGRDFVAEYVAACRNAGLGVGLYISVKDWAVPACFEGPSKNPEGWKRLVQYFHNQVEELMTNYGKIDILWYDGSGDVNLAGPWDNGKSDGENWRSAELNRRVRQLQPDILINNRSGTEEDFGTPEQTILQTSNGLRMNESCITMNDNWGYCPGDQNWKSARQLLEQLIGCAALGNNMLLNVGPDADGLIPLPALERLRKMGSWLARHGEAIYGTERALGDWWNVMSPGGKIITKGSHAYVILDEWDIRNGFCITSLKNEVLAATLMPTGEKLSVKRKGRRIVVSGLPHYPPSFPLNVVKLELDGAPLTQYYNGAV